MMHVFFPYKREAIHTTALKIVICLFIFFCKAEIVS